MSERHIPSPNNNNPIGQHIGDNREQAREPPEREFIAPPAEPARRLANELMAEAREQCPGNPEGQVGWLAYSLAVARLDFEETERELLLLQRKEQHGCGSFYCEECDGTEATKENSEA